MYGIAMLLIVSLFFNFTLLINHIVTKLSVNINKIATIRNARGGNIPNVLQAALDIEEYGADGITVHPRPDGRHIRYKDVLDLSKSIKTELNVEGYPSSDFLKLIEKSMPYQVTLVPDPPEVLTSNAGWDTIKFQSFLKDVVAELKKNCVKVSIFLNPDVKYVESAFLTGADCVELYTENFAVEFAKGNINAINPYIETAVNAKHAGLLVNAGHDLSLQNLAFFSEKIPFLNEVSIGHALISDALYFGLENTVKMYKSKLYAN